MRLRKVSVALVLNKHSLFLWVFAISSLKPMGHKAEEVFQTQLLILEDEVL
jgi:hypothetical protein